MSVKDPRKTNVTHEVFQFEFYLWRNWDSSTIINNVTTRRTLAILLIPRLLEFKGKWYGKCEYYFTWMFFFVFFFLFPTQPPSQVGASTSKRLPFNTKTFHWEKWHCGRHVKNCKLPQLEVQHCNIFFFKWIIWKHLPYFNNIVSHMKFIIFSEKERQ